MPKIQAALLNSKGNANFNIIL